MTRLHQPDPGPGGLPPGQAPREALPVKHYGRVPRAREGWPLMAVSDGAPPLVIDLAAFLDGLPRVLVTGDLHCASGWSTPALRWEGVPAAAFLDRFPPPDAAIGVLALAEYGYSANLRLADLRRPTSLIAVGLNGEPLPAEHGGPVRLVVPHLYGYKSVKWFRGLEYLLRMRRGFWEERGYHVVGDPWTGRRYSYQESG